VVLNTGRSDRKKADPIRAQTGTRMKNKVNRATVNEGNRFYYEVFENSPDNQQTLHKIRTRLDSIPSVVPLESPPGRTTGVLAEPLQRHRSR